MNGEQVDSFASLFPGPPGDQQREARKVRIKAERRALIWVVRTALPLRLRCFSVMTKHLECSIA